MIDKYLETYCTEEMVRLREESGVCIDEGCCLSGGFAHAGPCGPCNCGEEHAIAECPKNKGKQMNKDENVAECIYTEEQEIELSKKAISNILDSLYSLHFNKRYRLIRGLERKFQMELNMWLEESAYEANRAVSKVMESLQTKTDEDKY